MIAQRATDTILIEAPADTVLEVIYDLERYPEWTEEMRHVEVLSRDEEGRPVRAAFTVDARVVEVHYTLQYTHGDNELSWRLIEGSMLNRLDGSYVIEPADDRAHVTYTLVGDVDIPLPSFMKQRATKRILEQGLAGLKRRAESMA